MSASGSDSRLNEPMPHASPEVMGARWVRTESVANPEDKLSPEHRSVGGGYMIEEMTATKARIVNENQKVESIVTASEPPEEFRDSVKLTITVNCTAGKADYCCSKAGVSCTINYEPNTEIGDCGKAVGMTQVYKVVPGEGKTEFTLIPYVSGIGAMARYKYERR